MLSRYQSTGVILLTVFALYAGFSHFYHPFGQASATSTPSSSIQSTTNLKRSAHRSTFAKPLDRDSPFATYHNPDYSLSFRYPRTYSLTEDHQDFGDGSSLKSQEQLAADQPGLLLISSLEIPDDAYPNTTFSSGHLQFAVNPTLSEPACRSLAAPDESDNRDPGHRDTTGAEAIHGLVFHWRQSGEFANHMDYYRRDYFAYANNSCYEFFLQVAATVPLDSASTAGISSAPDASRAVGVFPKADSPKILRTLEKSVSTFQLHYN